MNENFWSIVKVTQREGRRVIHAVTHRVAQTKKKMIEIGIWKRQRTLRAVRTLKLLLAAGILIYEMLAGYPPFFDDNPFGIYEKILAGKIEWPRHMDPIAKDLVKKLLVQDRTKRLGNMKNGAEDVKRHRWVFWKFVSIQRNVASEPDSPC